MRTGLLKNGERYLIGFDMSFVRNIVSVFSARVFVRFLAFGTTVIIARLLGPEGQGKVALAFLVPTMLTQLVGFDMEVSNTYHTARDKESFGQLSGNSILFALLITPPVIYLFISFYDFVSHTFLQDLHLDFIGIALIIFPISLLISSLRGIILGRERFSLYNILVITISGITFLTTFIFLVLLKRGIYEAVVANLIGNLVGLLLILIVFILPMLRKISFSWDLFKEQIRYGVKPYIANLFGLLNYRVDLLLVSYYLTISSVGIYSLALGIVNRMQEIPHSIQTVFFPKTTVQTEEEANIFTPRLYRITGLIMLVIGLVSGVVAWFFIPIIFGERFSASITPFIIFLLGRIIIRGNVGILSTDLNGRGLPHFISLVSILCFLISVVFNIIAIPRWGIIGASVATSTTSLVQSVVVLMIYMKITGVHIRDFIPTFKDIEEIYSVIKDKIIRGIREKISKKE